MRALRRTSVRQYPGTALQVCLQDAPELGDALDRVLKGWRPAHRAVADPMLPSSTVQGTAGGFRAQSCYVEEPLDNLGTAAATCAVVADLAEDYFETRPGCIALHCAAFRLGGRLVAATGPARAGKSTLAARLTAEPDAEVFCDDVLPLLEDGRAVALGIAPRLRLPLPAGCSAAFRAHVSRTLGPRDDRYGYVCAETVAPHGTRAAPDLLLILDRRAGAPARLHRVDEDEALRLLLAQNMADLQSVDSALDRLSALLEGLTCLRLVYSDLEDAVGRIRAFVGAADGVAPQVTIHPVLPPARQPALPAARLAASIRWARNPKVVMQSRGGGAFLWTPGTRTVWHLNAMAHAVWTMLELPGSAHDIALVVAEVFPDRGVAAVTADVNALLQALATEGMVLRQGTD